MVTHIFTHTQRFTKRVAAKVYIWFFLIDKHLISVINTGSLGGPEEVLQRSSNFRTAFRQHYCCCTLQLRILVYEFWNAVSIRTLHRQHAIIIVESAYEYLERCKYSNFTPSACNYHRGECLIHRFWFQRCAETDFEVIFFLFSLLLHPFKFEHDSSSLSSLFPCFISVSLVRAKPMISLL